MEDQRPRSTSGPREGRLTVVADVITDAMDTDAVADSIFASLLKDSRPNTKLGTKNRTSDDEISLTMKAIMAQNYRLEGLLEDAANERDLKDGRLANNPGMESSSIEESMDEKIKLAVAAAVAEIEQTLSVDVRALREQTLVNINVVYDIFNSRPDSKLSALKFVTICRGPWFSAAIIRTQLDPKKNARPAIIVQADDCDSSDEALRKLYQFSQSVLNRAWELSEDNEAYFDIWKHLALHDSQDWWDESCGIGNLEIEDAEHSA